MSKTQFIDEIVATAFNTWGHQGRTDEQKWAVENFLTGSFTVAKQRIIESCLQDVRRAYFKGSMSALTGGVIGLIIVRSIYG